MDRSTLRAAFPEFASVETYPDAQVDFWLGQAELQLDHGLWAELWDQGAALLTAHNLTLARAAARSAAVGGAGAGLVASKSVGGASVSYDTGATTLEGGGAYNLTAYGTRFLKLARMVGLGGIQF